MDNLNKVRNEYQEITKNATDKVLNSLPLGAFILLFIFNVLLELVSVEFDISLMIRSSFWIKLIIKYIVIIAVFLVMYPFFKDMYMEGASALEIKNKAQKINNTITERRLSKKYKEFTQLMMKEKETEFFERLLNDCGNIDKKYLNREYSIKKLKQEYKEDYINKYQLKLLIKIKLGKIKFSKLTGDEIKYVGAYSIAENKKYSNQQSSIVASNFIAKIITMFIMGILIELILQSAMDKHISLREEPYQAFLKIFTVCTNYTTATMFAYQTSRKSANEYLRFTETVSLFTQEFIELVDENKITIAEEDKNNNITTKEIITNGNNNG